MKKLFLGGNRLADGEDIVGIFDLDITSQSYITRGFLSSADKAGRVINTADDIPKSYVICTEKGKDILYLCQPNSSTLAKRFKNEDY